MRLNRKIKLIAAAMIVGIFATLSIAIAQSGWSGFTQTSHTESGPGADGNTIETDNGTNANGDTITSKIIKGPDGRTVAVITTVRDKNRKIKRIINEKWGDPDKPWEQTFGYIEDMDPDQPDQEWDPKKQAWVNTDHKASEKKPDTGGVKTTSFKTSKGTVLVNLPDDTAAGDTISGTVVINPAGKTPDEQAQNNSDLSGYVVQVADGKSNPGQGLDKWIIPAGLTALTVALLDHSGHTVAHETIPIKDPPPAPGFVSLPDVGEITRPVQITGPFDGDATNSTVKIGGQPAQIEAESPRQIVAIAPNGGVGPTEIEVSSNGQTTKAPYTSVAINLAVGKSNLLAGEETQLHVTVQGLRGRTTPVPVKLVNRSPEIVQMTGGESQTVFVSPTSGGEGSTDLGIVGRQPGPYTIHAEVDGKMAMTHTTPAPDTPSGKALNSVFKANRLKSVADQLAAKDPTSDAATAAQKTAEDARRASTSAFQDLSDSDKSDVLTRASHAYQDDAAKMRQDATRYRNYAHSEQTDAAKSDVTDDEKSKLIDQAEKDTKWALTYDLIANEDEVHGGAVGPGNNPPTGGNDAHIPIFSDHHITYHPGMELQPITDMEGWFEPVQSVYQDDPAFLTKPGNQLHRGSPNSWLAELDMVAGKSTVITGIMADGHNHIVLKGKSNGAEWAEVKLKVTLIQFGAQKVVYMTSAPVGDMRCAGAKGAPTAFDVEIPALTGLPREGSAYLPFKIQSGSYALKAELVTTDGKPTGAAVYLDGECKTTSGPSVYILPATLSAGAGASGPTLVTSANNLATALALNGAAAAPVKDGGYPTFAEPLLDCSKTLAIAMQKWTVRHEDDADIPDSAKNDYVTNAFAAKLANFEDVLGRLGGNAKVIGVLATSDFDLTNKKSASVAAFTCSQKAIIMQLPYTRWVVAFHEVCHASPFLWSEVEMQRDYSFVWHNNHNKVGRGVKILPNWRQQFDGAEAIMNGAYFTDDSDERWIAFGTYWQLLHYYQTGGDPQVIDINGHFIKGQTKEVCILENAYTLDGVPDTKPGGPVKGYSISLLDGGGRVLAKYPVEPGYNAGDVNTMVGTFSLRVALPPNAVSYAVSGPSGVLAARKLSSAPPMLRVIGGGPTLATKSRSVHVGWSASSPDGLPLQYTVLYTEDGTNWAPAALEQDGTSLTFTWGLKPVVNPKPMIRIVATDGSRSSTVEINVNGR